MRQGTRKELEIISNSDSTTLKAEVKKFFEEHANDLSVDVQFTTTTAGHNAYIIYEQAYQIPEDIRDEYIIRGESYTCENCPYWSNNFDPTNIKGLWRCTKKVKYGNVRYVDEACLFFYQELAKGEIKPICGTRNG